VFRILDSPKYSAAVFKVYQFVCDSSMHYPIYAKVFDKYFGDFGKNLLQSLGGFVVGFADE